MLVNLIPHPSTPCELVDAFDVLVERNANALALRYRIAGRVGEILLPERRSPKRQDGLWQHTCFELFARAASSAPYCELNFSPSTCWAAYEFDDYRGGMEHLHFPAMPQIQVTRDSGHLSLAVDVDYRALAAVAHDDVRIALAAVVEHRDGRKCYWALAHPSPKPDFHHPDAFTLAMASGVAR
jgi:hypothetical protein